MALRAKPDFLNQIKLSSSVQSLAHTYFCFHQTQITDISFAIPHPSEGRFAIVTDVGRGERWTREFCQTSEIFADGKIVWS